MSRRKLFVAVLSSALLSVLGLSVPAQAEQNSQQVASALDEPVTTKGETFFTKTFYIYRSGDHILVSGSPDGTAEFYVDDLAQVVVTHSDGVVVTTQIDDSNRCTADHVITTPPTDIARYLQGGINKVSLVFKDACGGDFGNSDIWITGGFHSATPLPSLPSLDGGTFYHVHHLRPGQGVEQCTTGFGVKSAGRTYSATAKHCFIGTTADSSTNRDIARTMAVDVTTLDDPKAVNDKHAFATVLSCVTGRSACLLPPDRYSPSADMLAFTPDAPTTATGYVQTGLGRLPVAGEIALAQLPNDVTICHYGIGSLQNKKKAEQCGKSQGIVNGLGQFKAAGYGGDSGGPAYVYSASKRAVYALGVVILANSSTTAFIPIRSVLNGLNATLITAG